MFLSHRPCKTTEAVRHRENQTQFLKGFYYRNYDSMVHTIYRMNGRAAYVIRAKSREAQSRPRSVYPRVYNEEIQEMEEMEEELGRLQSGLILMWEKYNIPTFHR